MWGDSYERRLEREKEQREKDAASSRRNEEKSRAYTEMLRAKRRGDKESEKLYEAVWLMK